MSHLNEAGLVGCDVTKVPFQAAEVAPHLVLTTSFVGDGKKPHEAHRIAQAVQGVKLRTRNGHSARACVAFGVFLPQERTEGIGHRHQAKVPGNEVVQLTALTGHANAGLHEIEVARLKHKVRELPEERYESVLPAHGQHGVQAVGRRGGPEVLGGLVHFNA
jgi:hypothetical protein